mmetsp:Transcript_20658/g.32333  ORF Transcript_20658/g.32333 Transcript_20658/m.32333 type:complete len:205 (-) Transcript_20658:296-910(-)
MSQIWDFRTGAEAEGMLDRSPGSQYPTNRALPPTPLRILGAGGEKYLPEGSEQDQELPAFVSSTLNYIRNETDINRLRKVRELIVKVESQAQEQVLLALQASPAARETAGREDEEAGMEFTTRPDSIGDSIVVDHLTSRPKDEEAGAKGGMSSGAEGAAITLNSWPREDIQELVGMGFDFAAVKAALDACDGNRERAVNHLLGA